MYWCVGTEASAVGQEHIMDQGQDGSVDMGSKQSTLGNVSIDQSPMIESIQAAYKKEKNQ